MLSVALALGLGYAGLVAIVFVAQDRLLYFPSAHLRVTPSDFGWTSESVSLPTDDGETLHGWWLPADEERGVVLYCHGNAGNIGDRLPAVAGFHRLGLSVFLFDYRGYGRSTGTPSEDGLYRDAEVAWRYLTDTRGIDPNRIIVLGRSLGGGVASHLAHRYRPAGLVLESTFTSVPDVAAHHYAFLPARLLARTRFDNLARVRDLDGPLLIAHSPDDEVIPFAHGERLYAAAGGAKSFLRSTGSHQGGPIFIDPRYRDTVEAFLRQALAEEG